MRATQILDTHLRKHCQGVHQKRMTALLTITTALITGKKLTVTGLGRAICNGTQTKHNIKRADRLIGNVAMNQDRGEIYKAMAKLSIGQQHRPVILIDWSDVSADREFHMLRASIPVDGRSMTLYEESHHQRHDGNPHVQKRFLQQLKSILPRHCHPIIVTDAGFRTPWFRTVEEMGWDFVGRVGGHMMLSSKDEHDWVRVEKVFETATSRGRYLGQVDLVRQ
ncbi:MAG: IS4 family transposase, partial [Aliifodinibius sp.]|nr:IS4 family transposase [candidate division KSB1 bacterium]NIS26087.1 IS4 family transposase [candidate division KSB1 bacterium]NIT59399.1 IS4 family transposase [Fodinibius sp.]NIV71049.1 IS4 family transposase [Phycisphaerae bacterium]NIY27982.1 IS4 family transposase [Fodinibius sp.]